MCRPQFEFEIYFTVLDVIDIFSVQQGDQYGEHRIKKHEVFRSNLTAKSMNLDNIK